MGRCSKDFLEVRGLRSRGFPLQVEAIFSENSAVCHVSEFCRSRQKAKFTGILRVHAGGGGGGGGGAMQALMGAVGFRFCCSAMPCLRPVS